MPAFVDASVMLRYLTAEPAGMAAHAQSLIESDVELRITETALLETTYTLQRFYGIPRPQVVDLLVDFLQRENIVVHGLDKTLMLSALLLCRPSGRVSFGDALIWATARHAAPSTVYTFDRRFPSGGIEARQP
jgi:predicted nucleic-acid-binding protein